MTNAPIARGRLQSELTAPRRARRIRHRQSRSHGTVREPRPLRSRSTSESPGARVPRQHLPCSWRTRLRDRTGLQDARWRLEPFALGANRHGEADTGSRRCLWLLLKTLRRQAKWAIRAVAATGGSQDGANAVGSRLLSLRNPSNRNVHSARDTVTCIKGARESSRRPRPDPSSVIPGA